MCGIAGVLSVNADHQGVVSHMVSRLKHRGPDADGFWHNGPYCAGMRRLSILDVQNGNQPLFDASGKIVLFYNGEIYNSPTLRTQLEKEGYLFRTNSDGEVICHLYRKYGKSCFDRLDGMFAIALWDDEKKVLLLARDGPGEKPLYYSRLAGGGISFSSEIPSLLADPRISRALDRQSLWDYPSFLWVPEPATIYQDIKALEPGHVLEVTTQSFKTFKFAPRVDHSNIDCFSDSDIIELVRSTVTEAVTSRLLSDVPVGAFLSGGLDSSIVCSIAAQELNSLHTFCVGFEQVSDPYHGFSDESQLAQEYANKLGTFHTTIKVTSDTFRELLPQFLAAAGQPYAVSSGLGVLAIAKEAKAQGIKVLLSGDGADEAFGGYSWYPNIPLSFTANPYRAEPARFLDGGQSVDKRLNRMAGYAPALRAWAWHYYASESEKASIFHPDLQGISSLTWFESQGYYQPIDFVRQDRNFYFPNEMLSKLDRMTMAYSIEGRAPFAAPSVFSLASQLPWRSLVRNDQLKWALRQAFSDTVPQDIIKRPKHGFNVPIDHWLKGAWRDLFEETFSKDSSLSKQGLLSSQAHSNATKLLDDPTKIAGHVLFAFIMLNQWMTLNEN
jgi:asparagine synthase (glutamine-hydrolysing)